MASVGVAADLSIVDYPFSPPILDPTLYLQAREQGREPKDYEAERPWSRVFEDL